MNRVIEVHNLTKIYGTLAAVDGISFDVAKGEVFGLLGENGAGKTTTLEIIEGLRKPNDGFVTVLGHNIKNELNSIKSKIGVQLQASAYYKFLTLKEILSLFGSFYQKQVDPIALLKMVGLSGKAKSYVSDLSGGQKQRFSIVASLVNDPEIVFLDEPTTGLDPLARRHLWEIIRQIKKQGKTIILTTHYMEEAEVLCDRVAIMERGKIIALDVTKTLIERAKNPFKINFILSNLNSKAENDLNKIGQLIKIDDKKNSYEIHLKTQQDVNNALAIIHELSPKSILVKSATLEDVFIQLTGKTIQEENAS